MEFTTDLWEIAPESATRLGHPAPFPVALPHRLIDLYTYEGDVVLDPFMGSGSTAVAALRTGRHFIGFDTDPEYVAAAEARIADERARLDEHRPLLRGAASASRPSGPAGDDGDARATAVREGQQAKEIAALLLTESGFSDLRTNVKRADLGVELNVVATDRTGAEWVFEISGSFTSARSGLARTDTLWKALGKAAVLQAGDDPPSRRTAHHRPAGQGQRRRQGTPSGDRPDGTGARRDRAVRRRTTRAGSRRTPPAATLLKLGALRAHHRHRAGHRARHARRRARSPRPSATDPPHSSGSTTRHGTSSSRWSAGATWPATSTPGS